MANSPKGSKNWAQVLAELQVLAPESGRENRSWLMKLSESDVTEHREKAHQNSEHSTEEKEPILSISKVGAEVRMTERSHSSTSTGYCPGLDFHSPANFPSSHCTQGALVLIFLGPGLLAVGIWPLD
jgi:hypothetical protein